VVPRRREFPGFRFLLNSFRNIGVQLQSWFGLSGERLWVWQFNIPELIREIETRGMKCTYRSIGEISSLQRHFKWPFRDALLLLNNLCYRIGLSRVGAHTNLLVFKKVGNIPAAGEPPKRGGIPAQGDPAL
jgi:hypothetical protein